MNILYVFSGKLRQNAGGLDLVARQQILALANQGHKLWLLSRGRIEHKNIRNIRFPVTPANLISFLPSRYYYSAQHRFFSQIASWLLSMRRFDALVTWSRSAHSALSIAKRKKIPSILNCPEWHCSYPPGESAVGEHCWPHVGAAHLEEEYAFADALFVASSYAKNSFIRSGIPAEKICVIGRGADIQRYHSMPRSLTPFRTVFFGRACERKGIFQSIEAWKMAALDNAELWVIGDIPKELKPQLTALLPSNIHFFGHRNDAETLLPQCHVQLLPTRREGMAKSLVEGAACGLVTLTTPESGFPVQEGETGFYISRDDIEGTATRLCQLASQPDLWLHMSKQSAEFVRDNLTWDVFRVRFLGAFLETTVRNSLI